jgi:predicted phage terminase large subunit-like protein
MDPVLEKIAQRCRWDLFFLCKEILDYDQMEKHVHGDMCKYAEALYPAHPDNYMSPEEKDGKELEDQFHVQNKNLLLLMPRGTFKTSVITVGFSLQNFLNDPNIRILLDSETITKTTGFLREIKGHCEGNPKYREVFKAIHGMYPNEGKKSELLWKDNMLNLACRTRKRKEPSIMCSGVDKSINGFHFDLIISDDLHSEKNVTNSEQIEQVKEHWKLSFSLLDPGKPSIVIGTRWDYDDLYQHILDNERDHFNILIRRAEEKDGTLLFPEVLTRAFLDSQKRRQGSRIYAAQYLNEPIDDESATFKHGYFKYVDLKTIQDRPINWYLSIDPSYEGEYSDWAALVVAGMDFQQELYVRHITRAKMKYSEIITEIFRLYNLFMPKMVILETVGQQKSIKYELDNQMRQRAAWLPMKELTGMRKNKEERIRGLAPYYEFGHVWHVKGCPNIDMLESELVRFPRSKYDDVCDAFANILEFAQAPSPLTKQNQRRNRYPDDPPEQRRSSYKPSSSITGY